eukprot:6172009-Pleurochrysis_carterae.AAC.1
MDTVGQTQPRGAEADEAVSSSNQEPHSSSEGAGASADATRRDAELLAPSTPCENAPPPSAETDTVDSRPADETEHHAARDRCAASDDDDAESTDDEAADLTAPERSRLMETATQQLLAHNYQGARGHENVLWLHLCDMNRRHFGIPYCLPSFREILWGYFPRCAAVCASVAAANLHKDPHSDPIPHRDSDCNASPHPKAKPRGLVESSGRPPCRMRRRSSFVF